MSEKNHGSKTPSLPRRANTIHRFAHDLARNRLAILSLRQAASDKIGYAIAVCLGAGAYRWLGSRLVAVLAAGYLFNGWMSYRKYLAKKASA